MFRRNILHVVSKSIRTQLAPGTWGVTKTSKYIKLLKYPQPTNGIDK